MQKWERFCMEKVKKIISILSIMLVVSSSSIVIVSQNNTSVKATGGQTQQGINSIGLDLNYMWGSTVNISNAVHKAYNGQELRKGRLYGSNGTENYTKTFIYRQMKYNLSLQGVHNITLGPLTNQPDKFYTTFLNVINFNIHINTPGYPYPPDVPKNESYAAPCAIQDYNRTSKWDLNYNFSGTNIRVLTQTDTYLFNGGNRTIVNCVPVGSDNRTVGLAVYIADNDQMPPNQIFKVFLMNETQQCLGKLDNVTGDAWGVILIHHPTGYFVNSSILENLSSPVFRINSSSTVDYIISLIQNGEIILANNVINKKKMVFAYDYLTLWPDMDFYDLRQFNDVSVHYCPNILRILSEIIPDKGKCKGLIIYSDRDDGTHPSLVYNFNWERFGSNSPGVPFFTVNNSIGEFLLSHLGVCDTVSCFVKQELLNETHGTTPSIGVKAYDVVGHLNITHSPNDNIVIITNRHDSMVGECPGDSGTG